jgi:hypothetical protein
MGGADIRNPCCRSASHVTSHSSLTEAAEPAATHSPVWRCEHYTASVGGKTFHYSVKESPISGLGNEARALNVKAAGYSQVNVWSVVYRADGFVGAVTIVGPDASQASAKKLASQDTRTSASRCPSLTAAAGANW